MNPGWIIAGLLFAIFGLMVLMCFIDKDNEDE